MAKKKRKGQAKGARAGEGRPEESGAPAGRSRAAHSLPEEQGVGGVPKWLPAVLFVGLALFLFRAFVFTDQMLHGNDTLGLGYVARAFYADALSELGTIPRWSPLILGGTPFIEALASGDSLYPPSLLLLLIMEPYRALGWKLVVHYVAAAFFMFGWVRAIGGSRPAALLAGTAYMLAPYFVSLVQPGHDGKIFVTALAPLLFWAVERHFVRPRLKTVASIALVIGLVMLTTHFQMAYFLFGAVGMYAIYRSVGIWRGWDGDRDAAGGEAGAGSPRPAAWRFGLFLAASLLGAGVAAVQFVPAVEYVNESSRRIQTTRAAAQEIGVAWSSSWSAHPEDVMSLIIPEFSGNNSMGADWSQRTYWGRNLTKDNHPGAGLVILVLAALSFVGRRRRRLRYFFAGLGVLTVLFALGAHTPVWRFLYAVVPGIDQFRAVEQIMFLFAFSAATLGALGADRVFALARGDADDDAAHLFKVAAGVSGALFVLAFLAGSGVLTSIWTSVVYPGISEPQLQRVAALQPFIARGAGLAFLFALLTTGVVWAARNAYLAPAGALAVLVLLVTIDEVRVSGGFIQTLDFDEWSAADGFTQAVLQREAQSDEPYRLLSFRLAGQDVMPAIHGIELVAGHHPNDLARYREVIGMTGSSLPLNLLGSDPDIRRLLNVRYVLWPEYQAGGPFGPPETILARSQLQDGATYEAMYVTSDLPRARLVGAAVVKSDAEAVPYMLSDAFDPAVEVVLAEAPPITLDGEPSEGSVSWRERTPNRLSLSVTSARPALLVVADNWFPAWRATVDGSDAPVLRAYHTLRAVPVPAGEHEIEMVYESTLITRMLAVSLLLTFGLLGAIVFEVVRERRAGRGS